MENMKIYEAARVVPEEAKKPINAGRLKGMTDINPMWRIKKLTELFGPCGSGWWYTVDEKRIVDDEKTGQRAAFVDITLYYKDPETGEPSRGVPGTGGASFVSQERNGPYLSDECFKMALTDAISVSAKALGIGADVYFQADRSKYSLYPGGDPGNGAGRRGNGAGGRDNSAPANSAPTGPAKAPKLICAGCGAVIAAYKGRNGNMVSPEKHVQYTRREFRKDLCLDCAKKEAEALKAAAATEQTANGTES